MSIVMCGHRQHHRHRHHRHHCHQNHQHNSQHDNDVTWSSSYGRPWSGITCRWLAVTINSATATDHGYHDYDCHDYHDGGEGGG